MASSPAPATEHSRTRERPSIAVTVLGALMALWCLGFAAVNLLFEITDYLVGGPYAEYASGISVANWSVAC